MSQLTKRQERAWDPFAELREMSDRLSRLFESDPFSADEAGIEATQTDGALSVRIPKAQNKQPRSRQVKVG